MLKNFNKLIFLGASNSLNFPKTQQCIAKFKIIEKNFKNIKEKIKLRIGKRIYNLLKEETSILLDEKIDFEGAFYKTIDLNLFVDAFEEATNLITIYFNQINYFYLSIKSMQCNSIELIFYKKFPAISFDS